MDDYIELPDGRRIGRLDHVFKGITAFKEAQIVQNSRENCTVYVVTNGSLPPDVESRIKHNFRARVGNEISISVEQINAIPRGSNGKFKNVVRSLT
jgi:phenylacetate-CoA ligase